MDINEMKSKILDIVAEDVDRYLSGEKDGYFYKCLHTKEYGDTDANNARRHRLLLGLRFGVREIGEPLREHIVRELFEQETIAREKASYQGIGANIEILTALMTPYRKDEDKEMFQRVKDANFDCYCGYDLNYDYADMHPESLDSYSLVELIHLAYDIDLHDILCELVDEYKAQGLEGDRIYQMNTFARYTGRDEDRRIAVEGAYKQAFRPENTGIKANMQQLSAAEHMIELLCEDGKAVEAFELLKEHTQALKHGNHRAFYESAYLIMQTDKNLIQPVWEYVRVLIGEVYTVCICDVKKCAELAGDKQILAKMEKLEKKTK